MAKLSGYILAVDQATNLAGVSLWLDGALVATSVISSRDPSDSFAKRVQYQIPQLTAFLQTHLKPGHLVNTVIFEGVRARLIMAVVGAFLTCPLIDSKMSEKGSFVESSSWKSWARDRGATGPHKDIKGVKALRETGFNVDKYGIVSDDVCDSIMIFLCWKERK